MSSSILRSPDWWWHEAHQLHDNAHHQAHRPLDLCVPLWNATPESRAETAEQSAGKTEAENNFIAGWNALADQLDLPRRLEWG
jgi:hypothetical protein